MVAFAKASNAEKMYLKNAQKLAEIADQKFEAWQEAASECSQDEIKWLMENDANMAGEFYADLII